jgi:AraC family transcriptional regulator
MDPLTRMVEHHIWMTGEMIVRAASLTDEQLDAPLGISDDDKTLRRMLSRLVGQLDLWNRAISGEVYDFSVEHDEDVAGMRERFAEVAPRFLAEIHDVVADGRLDETFTTTMRDPARTYTYAAMIEHVLTFSAHNRTLVLVSLKKAGVRDLDLCISEAVGTECDGGPVNASWNQITRHRNREA